MKFRIRRTLHWLLFIVAALTTLVVLFYAEENWRGARVWEAAKHDLQARGESLDPKDFIPPSVPDNQNLAMAPLFTRMFRYAVDPVSGTPMLSQGADRWKNDTYKEVEEMPWGHEKTDHLPPSGLGSWMTGHNTDLMRAQQYFRQRKEFPQSPQSQNPADDVLLALTRYEALLAELAQAVEDRPQTRFPVNWTGRPAWNVALPHYNLIMKLTQTLRLRATAELAAGQRDTARRDVILGFRLRGATEHDPLLVASLVDITLTGILMQTVWEGLAARQWSPEDLDALRNTLGQIDVLREYQRAVQGERTLFLGRWADDLLDPATARQYANISPRMFGGPDSSSWESLEASLWIFMSDQPRGWYMQNAATACRYLQEYVVASIDPSNHRVVVAKSKNLAPAVQRLSRRPGQFLAKQMLGVYENLTRQFAQAQTVVDQAVTACALERYYLDHQAYPPALAALVPTYLDHIINDVIDGAPMRYRLTADGRFQLWSIGWNETDDGGTIVWPLDRTWRKAAKETPAGQNQRLPNPVRDQGDWVWQYAPAEPPDPPANQSRLESLHP